MPAPPFARTGRCCLSRATCSKATCAPFLYGDYADGVDLLAGGPPCQPFSVGGKHAGMLDARNMFPEMIRAARELRPKAILVENVSGLTRRAFHTYLEYIRLQLSFPEVTERDGEAWPEHMARLERHRTSGSQHGLQYNLVSRVALGRNE